MTIDDDMDNIRAQIEQLQEMKFTDRGGVMMPVLQGEPPADARSWGDLTPLQMEQTLVEQIHWDGFTPEQETAVVENVAAGKPPEEWMQGVEPDLYEEPVPTPEETRALFAEWTEDYALRSMPEQVMDHPRPDTPSLDGLEGGFTLVEEMNGAENAIAWLKDAVGDSPLPDSIRDLESDYHQMLRDAANESKHQNQDKDKDIER